LTFSKSPKTPLSPMERNLRAVDDGKLQSQPKKRQSRSIPTTPERVLDAPELLDDYYLNLLDWSSTNVLAIALDRAVYLWDAGTASIQRLCRARGNNFITSLSWSHDGSCLAVGTNGAEVQLWDVQRLTKVRTMDGHSARVSSLAWNGHLLSSGSRDASIIHHDVRSAEHSVASLTAHHQEVCGLRWSKEGTALASGGNDNLLNIWDLRSTAPRFTFDQHLAAVKALAWCPFQSNLLASGGGTADRCIRFWNTQTGVCTNTVDTKSQVCALQWSNTRELVSAHGFSQNQITIWKYPTMVKQAELQGHTSRVLHLAMSPDGTTIVSAAGDETLRFWKVFGSSQQKTARKADVSAMNAISIR